MRHMLTVISLVFYMSLILQAQNSEKQILWNEFKKDFPGQNIVKWNSKTDAPKRIIGDDIFLLERSINQGNMVQHTESFLKKYQALLNFCGSELKCEKIITHNRSIYNDDINKNNNYPTFYSLVHLFTMA